MRVFVVIYKHSETLVGVYSQYSDAVNRVYNMVQFGGYHHRDYDILEGDVE